MRIRIESEEILLDMMKQGESESASEVELGIWWIKDRKSWKTYQGKLQRWQVGGRQSRQSPAWSGVGELHLRLFSLSSDSGVSRPFVHF